MNYAFRPKTVQHLEYPKALVLVQPIKQVTLKLQIHRLIFIKKLVNCRVKLLVNVHIS